MSDQRANSRSRAKVVSEIGILASLMCDSSLGRQESKGRGQGPSASGRSPKALEGSSRFRLKDREQIGDANVFLKVLALAFGELRRLRLERQFRHALVIHFGEV